MPTYTVSVSFRGCSTYTLEAPDEEEAQDLACMKCEWDNPDLDSLEPGEAQLMGEE